MSVKNKTTVNVKSVTTSGYC